ncbi:phage minor capsid protein [Rhodococcus aetherivorans]|uniref:phage minor capsid protein n=1 Tax=Rhodococcus aetherivorans TaxID=191292 RepID=UPI0002D217E4|nr:phage minor capsid protein [Rhodococcus aetherivorans]CCW12908.1 protein gp4 [Rhodococcus aetherivorans]
MNRLLDRLWRWVDALVTAVTTSYDWVQSTVTERLRETLRVGLGQPLTDEQYRRTLNTAVGQYQSWLRRLVRTLNTRTPNTVREAFATLRADFDITFPRKVEQELINLITATHTRIVDNHLEVRRLIRRVLATNPQTPAERQAAVDRILRQAEREGYDLYTVDSRGRRIPLNVWARRAVDGHAANVALSAYQRAMQASGLDLVRVSSHDGTCSKCAPWQGRVLSLNGTTDGYPTLAQARAGGLFHISCRHGLVPTTP